MPQLLDNFNRLFQYQQALNRTPSAITAPQGGQPSAQPSTYTDVSTPVKTPVQALPQAPPQPTTQPPAPIYLQPPVQIAAPAPQPIQAPADGAAAVSGTFIPTQQYVDDDLDAKKFTTSVIHAGDEVEDDFEESITKEIGDETSITIVESITEEGVEPPNVEAPEGYEMLENYWVKHPDCSIAIMRSIDSQNLLYYLVEPELEEFEKGLLEKLSEHLRDILSRGKLNEKHDRTEMLESNANRLLKIYGIGIDGETRKRLFYYLHRDFIGFGKLDGFMADPNIEDISCDGVKIPIFLYHRRYQNTPSNVSFEEDELDIMVVKLAQKCGKHISIGSPITQATLPDGSRLEATLGREVTTRGSSFTIRRFRSEPFSPVDLVNYDTYSVDMLAYMWLIIENNMNFIISGGTASGKTSTLNAFSIFIPPSAKIVSIEDTRELTLYHQNWVPKVTREGMRGRTESEINMFDLLRSALRERPEYILVGEVRGPEAQVLFQAMNTGHTTYSTMHAGTVQGVVNRLINEPINVPIMMLQALNIVITQGLVFEEGHKIRRCNQIIEITAVDQRTGNLSVNEVFTWSPYKGKYERKTESFMLQKIMKNRGWNSGELEKEINNRIKIIKYLIENGIHRYADVANVIESYYRNPEWVMEKLKNGEL